MSVPLRVQVLVPGGPARSRDREGRCRDRDLSDPIAAVQRAVWLQLITAVFVLVSVVRAAFRIFRRLVGFQQLSLIIRYCSGTLQIF